MTSSASRRCVVNFDLSGLALVEIGLDFCQREFDARRAAIHDTAERRAMAFAPGGDPEQMAERIVRHDPEFAFSAPVPHAVLFVLTLGCQTAVIPKNVMVLAFLLTHSCCVKQRQDISYHECPRKTVEEENTMKKLAFLIAALVFALPHTAQADEVTARSYR